MAIWAKEALYLHRPLGQSEAEEGLEPGILTPETMPRAPTSHLERWLLKGEPAPSSPGIITDWQGWACSPKTSGSEHVEKRLGALGAEVPAEPTSFLSALKCSFAFNFSLFRLAAGCLRSPLSLA